ncbi:uncharacterized protein [Mytilus edulis]
MSTKRNMLKFLTHKLKSQTLNEVQPYTEKEDDDRDSGTESDEENEEDCLEADEFNNNKCRRSLPIPVNQNSTTVWGSTHEISEHNLDRISCTSDYNLDSISCTSDYERQSLDFEHHSSEEELEILHKEFVAEKRKRLQPNRHCDSASDEEVKEFMLQPQPINFSSSPPKVVHTQITPVTVMTISSRKRHRQNTTSDSSPMDSSLHRPSLDFEKMQKNAVKKQCTHGLGRAKIVKIKTVNANSKSAKSDPGMFTFKSISSNSYSSMTPVEEPSCAY